MSFVSLQFTKNISWVRWCALGAVLLLCLSATGVQARTVAPRTIASQVIVRLDPDLGHTIEAIIQTYGTIMLDILPQENAYLLQTPPGTAVEDLENVLNLDTRLDFAETIYSTFPQDGYAWWSGTSMAAPFVSGHADQFAASTNRQLAG